MPESDYDPHKDPDNAARVAGLLRERDMLQRSENDEGVALVEAELEQRGHKLKGKPPADPHHQPPQGRSSRPSGKG